MCVYGSSGMQPKARAEEKQILKFFILKKTRLHTALEVEPWENNII